MTPNDTILNGPRPATAPAKKSGGGQKLLIAVLLLAVGVLGFMLIQANYPNAFKTDGETAKPESTPKEQASKPKAPKAAALDLEGVPAQAVMDAAVKSFRATVPELCGHEESQKQCVDYYARQFQTGMRSILAAPKKAASPAVAKSTDPGAEIPRSTRSPEDWRNN